MNGTAQALWNSRMTTVEAVVEWNFAKHLTQQSCLDFRSTIKLFVNPVAKYNVVDALLINVSFLGNQPHGLF